MKAITIHGATHAGKGIPHYTATIAELIGALTAVGEQYGFDTPATIGDNFTRHFIIDEYSITVEDYNPETRKVEQVTDFDYEF